MTDVPEPPTPATGSAKRICHVSRMNGFIRASMLALGGTLLGLPAALVWPGLQFVPSTVSNRLTDYSLAIAVGVPFVAGLYVLWRGLRWLSLACWPAVLCVEVDQRALRFRLGPFGQRRLDWERMDISYSFERELQPDEEPDPDLLALDEDEEMRIRLPRMRHPAVPRNVNDLFIRHVTMDEPALVAALQPYIERARTKK